MIGPDEKRNVSTFEPVSPYVQSHLNSQELSVTYIITSFCRQRILWEGVGWNLLSVCALWERTVPTQESGTSISNLNCLVGCGWQTMVAEEKRCFKLTEVVSSSGVPLNILREDVSWDGGLLFVCSFWWNICRNWWNRENVAAAHGPLEPAILPLLSLFPDLSDIILVSVWSQETILRKHESETRLLGARGKDQGKSNKVLIHYKSWQQVTTGSYWYAMLQPRRSLSWILYTPGTHQGALHQLLHIGAAQEPGSCGEKLKPYLSFLLLL